MRYLGVAVVALVVWGCASKKTMEYQQELQAMPAAEVEKLDSMDTKRDAIDLKFNAQTTGYLDDKSPVMNVGEKSRSYFQRYKMIANGSDQFVEIRAFPYKPFGFGQIGIIQPLLFAFDEKGTSVELKEVFNGYDRSFVDGDFYRAVWRLRGLQSKQPYYLVVAARPEAVGKRAKDLPNYGGAVVGVVMSHPVQFSPVGKFAILQSDSFKK